MLGKQRAIRQSGQRIMKSRVTEMLATCLKLSAGPFQLFNVTIEFFNVLFRLFGSEALSFSACVFGLGAFTLRSLSLRCRCPNVFQIFFVREVDDRDYRKRREHGIKANRVLELHNSTG